MTSRNLQFSGRMSSQCQLTWLSPCSAGAKLAWYRFGLMTFMLGLIGTNAFVVEAQETVPYLSQTQVQKSRASISRSAQSTTVADPMVIRTTLRYMSGLLGGNATQMDYNRAFRVHLENSINDRTDITVSNVAVVVKIVSQQVIFESQNPSQHRSLLASLNPLEVATQITIKYQSNQEYVTSLWVVQAFDSAAELSSILQRLKQLNTAFNNVNSIMIAQADGSVIGKYQEGDGDSTSNDSKVGIIVGVVCGVVGGAVIAALAIFYFMRRSPDDEFDVNKPMHNKPSIAGGSTAAETDPSFRMVAEIDVERQDDVSTLGDPIWRGGAAVGGMAMHVPNYEESTTNVVDDHIYANNHLLLIKDGPHVSQDHVEPIEEGHVEKVPMSPVKSEPLDSPVSADDSSVQQNDGDGEVSEEEEIQFEVQAPPGTLGMAIDTPMGGVPEVHTIKAESVLADKVQVGDRLVSVDGEDVTHLTAAEVTTLISTKSEQHRVLIFARTVVKDSSTVRVRIDSMEIM